MTDPMELVERLDDCATANRGLGRDGLVTLLTEAAACIRDLVEWRPIETAPKDGVVIDVWREDGGRDTVFWGMPFHECGEMGRYCDSDWHRIRSPGWVCNIFNEFLGRNHNPFTHWRPLPTPPSKADRGGA